MRPKIKPKANEKHKIEKKGRKSLKKKASEKKRNANSSDVSGRKTGIGKTAAYKNDVELII